MTPRPLIFISAVSRELRSARQLVANTLTFLGYQPVWQDIFGTETGDLRSVLREKIDQCKGVVQLVGQSYGAEPPTANEEFGRVSYTQYEALYARKRGKKVWYLFIDENFPRDPCEQGPEELQKLQADYRRRLQSDTHIFHPLTSHEALEAGVLKLRDDLTRLRRGVKRWAVGVITLLLLVAAASLWLVQAQRRQGVAIQKQGEQVTTIVDRYQKMQQALVRLADVEAQAKEPGAKLTPEEQRARAYSVLEKDLGLPADTLTKELPGFALELYSRADTTPLMRARAAYALNKFDEAKKLSLEGAARDVQAYETAQRVQEERRTSAIQSYTLAGQSAQKLIQYNDAMLHFREAEKLTDRGGNPENWANVQYAIGYLLIDQGKYHDAEITLRAVVEVRTHALGSEHPDTLLSRDWLDLTLLRQGKAAEAEADYRTLIKLEEKVNGAEREATLGVRHRLGLALEQEGKYAEAEAEDRGIIKLKEKVLGPEHPRTLATRANLAVVLHEEGKDAESEAEIRQILPLEEKVLGPTHPDTIQTRSNLAYILDVEGSYGEAEAGYREVLRLDEKLIGPEHPETIRVRACMADVLEHEGKYAEAETENRMAVGLYEKVSGHEHPWTLAGRTARAGLLELEGKYAEAEAEDRDVIKLDEKVLGPLHSDTLQTRSNLAKVLDDQGKYVEAETEDRDLIKHEEKVLGAEHPLTLETRSNLAKVFDDEGKYAEAEAENRQVIQLKRKKLGAQHPDTLLSRSNFAKVLTDEGKYMEAEAEYRDVIKLEEKVVGPEHPNTLDSCYDFASGLRRQNKLQEAKQFARRAAEGARKVLGPNHPSTKKYEKLFLELQVKP